jgi:hypothetical protein
VSNEKQFGIKEGLGRRLNTWAHQLSLDKRYPWVGTGLLDDLKLASKLVGGAPSYAEMFEQPLAAPEPVIEYDL